MTTQPASFAELDGTAWRATRFGPGLVETPAEEQEFSLEVQGDRLAGKSGCNRYMGGWEVETESIRIGPLASTMMWCEGLMDLERAFLEALQAVQAAHRDGEHLVLADGEGNPLIELAPVEDAG
ncbi:MAG TPA: META domain-containing protein [Candidatus Limnocylindria bacterium]|jgi:heat shock protein HslJ